MMVIMRYKPGHKAAIREKIVRVTARALRSHGLEGISIPALMKEAGLTHGGFYAHFRNRDELVAEAIDWAAAETSQSALASDLSLNQSMNRYLSAAHLENPEAGCVLAALGTESGRQASSVRQAFSRAALGFLRINQREGNGGSGILSDRVLVRAATMIGAIILGRLVQNSTLAGRIINAAKESVLREAE